MYKRDWN